ncbi:MAG: ribosome rescue protein RqcH [Candidatus Thalassarchaeaceae archaeon]|nr:ribosome rescue protein RqcH [Candidatus Thalassarchaeaceae archaeon]
MRDQMSSFDIARMVLEIDALAGARCRKVYQPHYEQVVLRLNPKGMSNRDLVIVRGQRTYFSQRDRPMPTHPPQFAMLLRKHLANARLIGASQLGFDRIIVLEFDTKDGRRDLVIEMFRNGNVILLDPDGIIIQPLTHVAYETRIIKRGEVYAPPPEPMDPRNWSQSELGTVLADSDRDLVNTLAGRMSLGSVYARAMCAESSLDPNQAANEITDATPLYTAFQNLIGQIDAEGAIAVVRETFEASANPLEFDTQMEEHCLEVGPVQLSGDALTMQFDSLSHAIDAWKGGYDASALARREAEKLAEISAPGQTDSEEEKLSRREGQQAAAVDKLTAKGAKQQEIGKSIQENWEHVESLLNQVTNSIDEIGWDETRKAIKKIHWIESANPESRTIQAKLPDENGDPGLAVELYLDETVHQNAQRYFAKGRKDKQRAEGAKSALADTQKRQKKVDKQRVKDEAAGRVSVTKRSKKFWFERNRWTMLSSGQLFVGGRDAKGNDQLVKKHLTPADLYFHADLHGAPSCTLKLKEGFEEDPNPNPTLPEGVPSLRLTQSLDISEHPEEALTGAAQMAVCWSRAWGSGGAAATAFHAKQGQVSKTTESGESLGRGAFIVRGNRHWYKDLSMQITLGMVAVNGVPLPLVGTHDVISSVCERWVRLTPGTQKKEQVATKIAKATGLLQDDVLSALPPGNVSLGDSQGIFE